MANLKTVNGNMPIKNHKSVPAFSLCPFPHLSENEVEKVELTLNTQHSENTEKIASPLLSIRIFSLVDLYVLQHGPNLIMTSH